MAVNASTTQCSLCCRPRRDACLDLLQALSGAALVLFMWCHMLLVSSVIISPKAMNAIAEFFEYTYMVQIGGPIIFLAFLVHFALTARKIPFTADGQHTAFAHAKLLHHRDTWLWIVQIVTAMLILVMGAIHMWVVLNDLPITAVKSAARVQSGAWLPFFCILLTLVEAHVSIGAYRILVKWGFITSQDRAKFKRYELYLFCGFMTVGIITLIVFATMATAMIATGAAPALATAPM